MELKSVTFYFEGFEITKQQVLQLFEKHMENVGHDESSLSDYIEELCNIGSVDIPKAGIVSVVTEVFGLPDEFEFDEL
jgi:hypothetical protein